MKRSTLTKFVPLLLILLIGFATPIGVTEDGVEHSISSDFRISDSIDRDWNNLSLLYENQFHDPEELEEEIEYIHATVPELVDVEVIGQSYEGRDIYSIRITNEEITTQKAKALVVAHHHGREQVTVDIALRFVLRLLNAYGHNPTLTEYIDTEEIYIIPTINPDALEIVVNEGNHWLRKNLRPYDDDGDGQFDEDSPQDVDGDGWISSFDVYLKEDEFAPPVYSHSYYEGIDDDGDGLVNEDHVGLVDLNRNYESYWGMSPSSSSDPDAQTYRGSSPFSEPETQAFRDFALQHKFAMAYSLHTGINATYFSRNNFGQYVETSLYTSMMNDYAELLPDGFNDFWDYDGADQGVRNQLESALSGGWREWMYHEHGTLAPVTFEIYTNASARDDTLLSVSTNNRTHYIEEWEGIYGFFNPIESYIDALWQDLIPSFDYLLEMTPRMEISASSVEINESDPDILDFSITSILKGKRIGTIDSINVSSDNNIIYTDSETYRVGDVISLQFQVPRDELHEQNLTLLVGNEYVGYLLVPFTLPSHESGVDGIIVFTVSAVTGIGILAIVVIVLKRR